MKSPSWNYSYNLTNKPAEPELKHKYDNKNYFDLNDAIQKNDHVNSIDVLFFKGAVNNKFNRLGLAINYINRYIAKSRDNNDDKYLKDCYEILADSYIKLYQYRSGKYSNSYK
jgi:hypothetical protein